MPQQIAFSGSPVNQAADSILSTSTYFHQPLVSVNEVIFTPSAPALPVFSDSAKQPNHQTDEDTNNNTDSNSSDTMPNFDCALTAAIEALLAAIAGEPMPTSIYLYMSAEATQQVYARLAWHTTCVACYSLVWPPATTTVTATKSKRNAQRQQRQTLSYGWKLFSAGAAGFPVQVWKCAGCSKLVVSHLEPVEGMEVRCAGCNQVLLQPTVAPRTTKLNRKVG